MNDQRATDAPYFPPFPPEWIAGYSVDDLERLAVLTVDGGLSDAEAEAALKEMKNAKDK